MIMASGDRFMSMYVGWMEQSAVIVLAYNNKPIFHRQAEAFRKGLSQ
jgi:hypothetical protein